MTWSTTYRGSTTRLLKMRVNPSNYSTWISLNKWVLLWTDTKHKLSRLAMIWFLRILKTSTTSLRTWSLLGKRLWLLSSREMAYNRQQINTLLVLFLKKSSNRRNLRKNRAEILLKIPPKRSWKDRILGREIFNTTLLTRYQARGSRKAKWLVKV